MLKQQIYVFYLFKADVLCEPTTIWYIYYVFVFNNRNRTKSDILERLSTPNWDTYMWIIDIHMTIDIVFFELTIE